jgi:hypothetical protein
MIGGSSNSFFGEPAKGRIGPLIEEHLDQIGCNRSNAIFSKHGHRGISSIGSFATAGIRRRSHVTFSLICTDGI